ncbi:hypothetical protein LPTSP2_01570 [Leptospira ellinghausenii]|uniref:Uncharacterized protein n=1 Tax=Leptospira ellinghausenii TaxID=1917822 RepID=A0A2P2D8H5_9LEPT|nr:hypothetical protein LPTSP2_01570 [Leptospira ellinghausenii]
MVASIKWNQVNPIVKIIRFVRTKYPNKIPIEVKSKMINKRYMNEGGKFGTHSRPKCLKNKVGWMK